jgi:2-oxoglutarate dehydrogenase E2 component (dihydrolipoamide succinyltransferase)
MTRMRARIAERLKESQNSAASLTTFNEVDMSALFKLRSKYKQDILEKHAVKFGFMSPFIKAASVALREIPAVNGRIEGDTIVYQDYTDISVAVATPKGLVTPVLRNTHKMGMIEIEKELARMSKKVFLNNLNSRREMDN